MINKKYDEIERESFLFKIIFWQQDKFSLCAQSYKIMLEIPETKSN